MIPNKKPEVQNWYWPEIPKVRFSDFWTCSRWIQKPWSGDLLDFEVGFCYLKLKLAATSVWDTIKPYSVLKTSRTKTHISWTTIPKLPHEVWRSGVARVATLVLWNQTDLVDPPSYHNWWVYLSWSFTTCYVCKTLDLLTQNGEVLWFSSEVARHWCGDGWHQKPLYSGRGWWWPVTYYNLVANHKVVWK